MTQPASVESISRESVSKSAFLHGGGVPTYLAVDSSLGVQVSVAVG